ncbi:MAG: amino acid adenylation domain-containing protein [Tumebacillaceae bacterium]
MTKQLSDAKRALLEQRLRGKTTGGYVEIPRREASETDVLSFSQERLWVLDQLRPGDPLYNITFAYRLEGKLQRDALEQSLAMIVARHEVLGANFQETDNGPVQVKGSDQLDWTLTDLQGVREDVKLDKAIELVEADFKRPFDLQRDRLFRAHLIGLHATDHVLTLTMHHIVADGWSIGILLDELRTIYVAICQGEVPASPSLPIQFADYAVWQRAMMQGDAYERKVAFWKERLGGKIPTLKLPTDRPRPMLQTTRGSVEKLIFSQELSAKIRQFAEKERVTPFVLLLTALYVLLFRYTDETDLVIGSTVADRERAEVSRLIGFFVNTIALRVQIGEQMSFNQLLGLVRQEFYDALSNSDVPFEKVVEAIQVERDPSRTPVFQILFEYLSSSPFELPGLNIRELDIEYGIAKFDLNLCITESDDVLVASMEYNRDLFDRDTITRMNGHYRQLLTGLLENPDLSVEQVQMLTDEEYQQIVFDQNATAVEFPKDLCLHQLFEQQVMRTPNNIAVVYRDQEVTYAELNAQANRLACRLQANGAGPDVPVAICMERSVELIVALLGVLKAGSAFVPLDPNAPTLRLKQLIQEAGAPILLVQQRLLPHLPTEQVAHCIVLDDAAAEAEWSERLDHVPAPLANPDHLVSIYYTSGSTGVPKGVASVHRGWVNRMHWMQRQHQLHADDTVLQKTTLTFDDAAVEVFWPLMVGARIAMLEPELHRDPTAILAAAKQYNVTVLQFVPSMLNMVLEEIMEEDRAQLTKLRVVVSSGEALRGKTVQQFIERMPGTLFNTWGATEVSIDSTVHVCTADDTEEGRIVSVGKPIDNNQVYILDRQLQPVPYGVPGDLYLAGIGLAREYWKNPEKTIRAFVDHPFSKGERMYKTGDRGYYRPDGSIQFLGRDDNQIKIRGMRVEMGEIESVLDQHPAVKECVVIPHEDEAGNKRLLGYVVCNEGMNATPAELRVYLKELIPNYMVPGQLTMLDAMPLNANGKVDRLALPIPDQLGQEREADYVAPRTIIEAAVCEIWEQVLQVERIGVHDHFFELGGHSLLATQVVSRIRKRLQIELPLVHLFERPTIAQLAEVVGEAFLARLDSMSEAEAEALLMQLNQ